MKIKSQCAQLFYKPIGDTLNKTSKIKYKHY